MENFTFIKLSLKRFYVSRSEYAEAKFEIHRANREVLVFSSFLISLLCAFLYLFACLAQGNFLIKNRFLYIFIFALMTVICIISSVFVERKSSVTTPLVYAFAIGVYVYAFYVGVFKQQSNLAVSFCVFLFVFPFLFIDKPIRINIFNGIITVLFCVACIKIKDPYAAHYDVLDSICCYIISIFSGMYSTKLKIREYSLKRIIEIERDTDELTGLKNKSALVRDIKKTIDKINEPKKSDPSVENCGILMIMDCDNFKQINDNFGHDVGDSVLAQVSLCIRRTFKDNAYTGRFGGDEFVIFMKPGTDEEQAKQGAGELLEMIRNNVKLPGSDEIVHGSLGLVSCRKGDSYEESFKRADNALYSAKKLGKDRFVFE